MPKQRVKKFVNNNQVFRFLVSGGISAAVEFTSFLLFIRLTGDVFWPALASFGCGLASSYLLNSRFVFKAWGRTKKQKSRQLSVFVMLGVFNAFLSSWLVLAFSHALPKIVAKFGVITFIAIWNYLIMKKIIFRDNNEGI